MAEKSAPAKKDWETEFFEKHGIKDDKEKDAIRARSRVLAYDRARQKADSEESGGDDKPAKKWYEE